MIILVINCGSSSIKYQLLDMKNDDVYDLIAKGIVEKIGLPTALIQYAPKGGEKEVTECPIPDHKEGMRLVLQALTNPKTGVLKSLEDLEAVGHRIVQGGEFFSSSAIVTDDVIEKIRFCCDFAPLHNPAHLLGIEAITAVLPTVPQVVTFDTAFHQTIPAYSYMYALPYEYYEKYRVRRYGAHGTSHQFVANKGAKMAGLDINNSKIITCHIGAGSSICAVLNGQSFETSMGFTPLEGMIMGTRVGNIDANAVLYLMKKLGATPDEMTTILNRKSGFLGMSGGKTSDCREMDDLAEAGDAKAKLVFKKLTHDMIKIIGSYIAEMNGVDLIVFTGGIGEHNSRLRRRVLQNFSYLGLKIDDEANKAWGEDAIITAPGSAVKAALVTTNEELVIARDTMHLVQEAQE
ncbi:MAG: acetate kinase [Bacteroidales bacterium]|nr:acetate kinase [Bacteroidales bacterium]